MAGALGGFQKRALLLAAAVSLIGSVAAAGLLNSADAAPPGASSRRMLLRLHDLPPGYIGNLVSAETGPLDQCDYLHPAEPQPMLAAFIDRYSPKGCFGIYVRLYRVPGSPPAPPVVGTGALDAGSVEAAEAGLAVAPELISHITEDQVPEEVAPTEIVGDATRLLHWQKVPSLFKPGYSSGSFLAWRSGSVLATVFVDGFRLAADDRVAAELAHIQQSRIEHPTPYTATERDDTEVPLEDPALEVPVYWLGRHFAPEHGLPSLWLLDTASATSSSPRVPRANLLYSNRRNLNHAEAIGINLWSPRQWKRLVRGRGKLPGSLRCATSTRLKLPRGHALIYRGFEGGRGPCPTRRSGSYKARVYLGRVVVTTETMSICAVCFGAGKGPFDSLAGMKAVVKGLAPRLRPTDPALRTR
jgi:hypothetical protein